MFFKIGVLRNSAIFTGKDQEFRNIHRKKTVLGSHFNKFAGLTVCNSILKKLHYKFLRIGTGFFMEHFSKVNIAAKAICSVLVLKV